MIRCYGELGPLEDALKRKRTISLGPFISKSEHLDGAMAGRKPAGRGRGRGKSGAMTSSRNEVPEVYRDMLAEAMSGQAELPERPLKKRRTARHLEGSSAGPSTQPAQSLDDAEEDEDIEFEDVLDPFEKNHASRDPDVDTEASSESGMKEQQTVYRYSDDESSDRESSDGDIVWDDISFEAKAKDEEQSKDLELTLTSKPTPQASTTVNRRKAITKLERSLRMEIHKIHVLCLLAHVDRRNDWCNDLEVQRALKKLLDKKMITFLKPKSELSQFGRAESLKRGLDMVSTMWMARYTINSRGMRRSLWAENEKALQGVRS